MDSPLATWTVGYIILGCLALIAMGAIAGSSVPPAFVYASAALVASALAGAVIGFAFKVRGRSGASTFTSLMVLATCAFMLAPGAGSLLSGL
jgi:hypothetical protein